MTTRAVITKSHDHFIMYQHVKWTCASFPQYYVFFEFKQKSVKMMNVVYENYRNVLFLHLVIHIGIINRCQLCTPTGFYGQYSVI